MSSQQRLTGTTFRLHHRIGTTSLLRVAAPLLALLLTSCVSQGPQGQLSKPMSPYDLIDWALMDKSVWVTEVKSYQDPDQTLSDYKTFTFEYQDKKNPLLEKELLKMLQIQLERKGLKHVSKNAEILVTMNYFTGKKEQYIPPKTITSTIYQSVWKTGFFGSTPVGYSTMVPVAKSQTEPGRTDVSYYRNIRLNFLDVAELNSSQKPDIPPLVWIGEAESEGSNDDIRTVALHMLRAMLQEFPATSGLPPIRYAASVVFGDIGVTLDYYDWRVVHAVSQGSPAEKVGIQAGDWIMKINGKAMARSWRSTYYAKHKQYASVYFRCEDPYYRSVLNNPGDVEIEFMIRPGGGGKTRKVRITPIVREHVLYYASESRCSDLTPFALSRYDEYIE